MTSLFSGNSASSLAISLADLASITDVMKGAGLVGYNSTLAYAANTVGGKLRQRINLRDVGLISDANFTTGAGTDNRAALQAAINNLSAIGGGVLVDDGGIYKISGQVTWPNGVNFIGSGKWGTIFMCPNTFVNTGGLFRLIGVGGYPAKLRGFALLSEPPGNSGVALVSVQNGAFFSDIWVNGYQTYGAQISSTDNFLDDLVIENCQYGLVLTYSNIHVTNTLLFDCLYGLAVQNSASPQYGRVHLTTVRATYCVIAGFILNAGKHISMTGCSADNDDNLRLTSGGIVLDSAVDVDISGFVSKIGGTASTTSHGIKLLGTCNDVTITGSKCSGFLDGINSDSTEGLIITGGSYNLNGRRGVSLTDGNKNTVTGAMACDNGTGSPGDAGIYSSNSDNLAIHTIVGNTCTQASGGVQDYGIDASVSGTGYTVVSTNTCTLNNTADVRLTGTTNNIKFTNNIAPVIVDTFPTVASATALTLPVAVDDIKVTGVTAITSIIATGNNRRTVRLIFAGILTLTDGSNLKLNGNFVTSADDTVVLTCDGTNWYEISRSAN